MAVIDTGGSARVGQRLHEAIRAVTQLPIRYVINTHMHPDHVFGNAAFATEHPTYVGHAKLPRALAARADRYLAINEELLGKEAFAGTRIIPPTLLVKDRVELDLGGRKLVVGFKSATRSGKVAVSVAGTNRLIGTGRYRLGKAGLGKAKVKLGKKAAHQIHRGKIKKVKVKVTTANGKTKVKTLKIRH